PGQSGVLRLRGGGTAGPTNVVLTARTASSDPSAGAPRRRVRGGTAGGGTYWRSTTACDSKRACRGGAPPTSARWGDGASATACEPNGRVRTVSAAPLPAVRTASAPSATTSSGCSSVVGTTRCR